MIKNKIARSGFLSYNIDIDLLFMTQIFSKTKIIFVLFMKSCISKKILFFELTTL